MTNALAEVKKQEWQRRKRREFQALHGFSSAANYSNGGNRLSVLTRDNYSCVKCGMSDREHKTKWSRPITVDHIDKNRKNNDLTNLQTLCLSCHGRKDLIPRLRIQRVPLFKNVILQLRKDGAYYWHIAKILGFSSASIFKWVKRWEQNKETI